MDSEENKSKETYIVPCIDVSEVSIEGTFLQFFEASTTVDRGMEDAGNDWFE